MCHVACGMWHVACGIVWRHAVPWSGPAIARPPVVQQAGEEFAAVHEARPGAVEHGVAVHERDTPLTHRLEPRPEARRHEGRQLLERLLCMWCVCVCECVEVACGAARVRVCVCVCVWRWRVCVCVCLNIVRSPWPPGQHTVMHGHTCTRIGMC
jgi:hypothetical protein